MLHNDWGRAQATRTPHQRPRGWLPGGFGCCTTTAGVPKPPKHPTSTPVARFRGRVAVRTAPARQTPTALTPHICSHGRFSSTFSDRGWKRPEFGCRLVPAVGGGSAREGGHCAATDSGELEGHLGTIRITRLTRRGRQAVSAERARHAAQPLRGGVRVSGCRMVQAFSWPDTSGSTRPGFRT